MLDQLKPAVGSRKPRKRLGRGIGSGLGKTSGRGQKGAGARSGFKRRAWYEGGQISLARRLPKRGFTSLFGTTYQVVNVSALGRFEPKETVDAAALAAAGLVPRADRPVKLLGNGELAVALQVVVDAASASAVRKLELAGGSVTLVPKAAGAHGTEEEAGQ